MTSTGRSRSNRDNICVDFFICSYLRRTIFSVVLIMLPRAMLLLLKHFLNSFFYFGEYWILSSIDFWISFCSF